MYEFVRFYVCSFELQFLMPYEDSDNPNSIFYVFGVYYIYNLEPTSSRMILFNWKIYSY